MARSLCHRLRVRSLEERTVLTTYTVNSLADAGTGSGNAGDLRYCVGLANADATAGPHVIDMTGLNGTITLTQEQITISATQSLVFNGPGQDKLTISGLPTATATNRIFNVTKAGTVTINGLTLANGNLSTGHGGAINAVIGTNLTVINSTISGNAAESPSGHGGGIALYSPSTASNTLSLQGVSFSNNNAKFGGTVFFVGTTLSLTDCAFNNNVSFQGGGVHAVNVAGQITVTHSFFKGNLGTGSGLYVNLSPNLQVSGCIFGPSTNSAMSIVDGTAVTVADSTIEGNSYGGIYAEFAKSNSTMSIFNCLFQNNSFQRGGAIDSGFSVTKIVNSTLIHNTATTTGTDGGGAICAFGTLIVSNSTIVNNKSFGGAAGGIQIYSGTSLTLQSSIVANNVGRDSFDVSFKSSGTITGTNNLIGVGDVGGFTLSQPNQAGTAAKPLDPLVSVLADNGGPTKTMGLLPGSPAIDKGNNVANVTTDQRGAGFPRVLNGTADVGAFEGVLPIPSAVMTAVPDITSAGGTTPNTVTVTYQDTNAVDVSTIDVNDVQIISPSNALLPVTGVIVDFASNGTPRKATYMFVVPGGTWDVPDNGYYAVNIVANQVANTNATIGYADAGPIGTIHVSIASTYVVNATNDETIDSDGKTSLREALAIANADSTTLDTITFDPVVFANPQTVIVKPALLASTSVVINGPGADRLAIDGGGSNLVWDVSNNSTNQMNFTLTGMKITNGIGGIRIDDEIATLDFIWVTNNSATPTSYIGGVTSGAMSLKILNSTVSGNTGSCGGVGAGRAGSYLLIRNCTIANNTGTGSGNFQGSGVIVSGDATTVTKIQNSTIANNTGTNSGGGLSLFTSGVAAGLVIESTIIAGNTAAGQARDVWDDYYISQKNATNSFIGIVSDPTKYTTLGTCFIGTKTAPADPRLGPLQNYGGPMPTLLPLPGSLVRDKGSNPGNVALDQRGPGFPRLFQTAVDMGAIESSLTADMTNFGPIIVAGTAPNTISVTYSDSSAIDWTTIDSNDIQIVSPNASALPITSVTIDAQSNGPTRTAIYSFALPGGGWDPTDNGSYTVNLLANQVANSNGLNLPAANLGLFTVSVPKIILVTSLADSGPGSLRAALQNATSIDYRGADTITFDPALVAVGNSTINVTTFDTGLDSGEAGATAFVIKSAVVIDGPAGNYGLTIQRSGSSSFRLFHVQPNASLALQGLTLSGGLAAGHTGINGGGASAGMGGGIFNQGLFSANRVTLVGNSAIGGNATQAVSLPAGYGGAGLGADNYFSSGGGPLGGQGGAQYQSGGTGGFGGGGGGGGPGSQFSSGQSGGFGGNGGFGGGGGTGGFHATHIETGGGGGFGGGAGYLNNANGFAAGKYGSSVGGAGGGLGGAVFSTDGNISLTNCTFTNDSAVGGTTPTGGTSNGQGLGGAIFLRNATATISNCTFSGNTAAQGGGAIFVVGDAAAINLTIDSSIIANTAGGATDFQSAVINSGPRNFVGGNNLIENNATAGDGFTGGIVSTADPVLAALANNGGPTQTLALQAGSPAINAGTNPLNLTTDQRGVGYPRVIGKAADIGAFEYQGLPAVISSLQINGGSTQRSRVTSLTVTFDRPVSLSATGQDSFLLIRQSDNATVTLNANVVGNVVTLTFTAGPVEFTSLADGRYTLTALAAQINGGSFDGNGDTMAGDNYQLIGTPANGLFRLFGDSNGDGTVNGADFLAFRLAFLSNATTFDFSNDGMVNGTDFLQFRLRFLQTI